MPATEPHPSHFERSEKSRPPRRYHTFHMVLCSCRKCATLGAGGRDFSLRSK